MPGPRSRTRQQRAGRGRGPARRADSAIKSCSALVTADVFALGTPGLAAIHSSFKGIKLRLSIMCCHWSIAQLYQTFHSGN